MSLYDTSIPQFKKMLLSLDKWLEKAEAHAKAKSFDPNVLLSARLAPDQYPLVRQVQSACDSAKSCAARLAGKQPPVHPDTEQTVDELHTRIRTVVTYLDSVKPEDFKGAETLRIALPFLPPGKLVLGNDFLYELQLPNFYFHVATAYAILRHNGVELGKMDFIGSMTLIDA